MPYMLILSIQTKTNTMSLQDIIKKALNEKSQIDFTTLLTEVVLGILINHCYSKAILESQVMLMSQLGKLPEGGQFEEHHKIITDKIYKEAE